MGESHGSQGPEEALGDRVETTYTSAAMYTIIYNIIYHLGEKALWELVQPPPFRGR